MLIREEDFLLKLIVLTLFVLSLSYVIFEITKTRLSLRRRLKIASIGALVLTLYTFFFLQGHSVLFNQESILSARISAAKKALPGVPREDEQLSFSSRSGKKQSFIFINTAYNHSLSFFGDGEDSTSLVLTNRAQLISLFSALASDTARIDLVATDLLFPESSSHDDSLFRSMAAFQEHKLVLAYYQGALTDNQAFYNNFDTNVFGDVSKQRDEPVYYSHTLYDEGRQQGSFSYQMYCKLNSTNFVRESAQWYIAKNFIAEFSLPEESILYNDPVPKALRGENANVTPSHVRSIDQPSVFTLGNAATADGQERIGRKLKEIKDAGAQAIVFIGNLTDDYVDLHQTAYGKVHGSTIILNELNYLEKGYHLMSWPFLISYLLFIYLFFWLIVCVMLWKADRRDTRARSVQAVAHDPGWLGRLGEWFESVLRFVADESYYLLILAMAMLIDLCFHKLINMVGLIYLVPLLSSLLKYYITLQNKKPQAAESPQIK